MLERFLARWFPSAIHGEVEQAADLRAAESSDTLTNLPRRMESLRSKQRSCGRNSLQRLRVTRSDRDSLDKSRWRVQIQGKSYRLVDLLDLFHRESGDSLLDQNLRQSGDVVKIDHATSRHAVTSV